MLSDTQELEIYKRVKETIELFLENDEISDEALAHLLALKGIKTSSSTVGRDLTGKYARELLEDDEFKKIQEKRANNKQKGAQKGGIKSSSINDIEKNEDGKFEGCKKRK